MRVLVLLFVLSLFHVSIPKVSESSATIEVIDTDPLTLHLLEQLNLQFYFYNVSSGQVLHWQENQVGPGTVQPDCPWEEMEQGIYYVRILTEDEEVVAKVVIRGR